MLCFRSNLDENVCRQGCPVLDQKVDTLIRKKYGTQLFLPGRGSRVGYQCEQVRLQLMAGQVGVEALEGRCEHAFR